MEIKNIPFETLSEYWREVDHFKNPNKKIRPVVRRLGPLECTLEDPRRESYGFYDGSNLMGGTHIVQWSEHWLRYRTLNLRPECRGGDLGWVLLSGALKLDWRDWFIEGKYLFGWVRNTHRSWAVDHGFNDIEGLEGHGDHVGMIRALEDLKED